MKATTFKVKVAVPWLLIAVMVAVPVEPVAVKFTVAIPLASVCVTTELTAPGPETAKVTTELAMGAFVFDRAETMSAEEACVLIGTD